MGWPVMDRVRYIYLCVGVKGAKRQREHAFVQMELTGTMSIVSIHWLDL